VRSLSLDFGPPQLQPTYCTFDAHDGCINLSLTHTAFILCSPYKLLDVKMVRRAFVVAATLIGISFFLSVFLQVSSMRCITSDTSTGNQKQQKYVSLTAASSANETRPYEPASTEAYILEHASDLGFNQGAPHPTRQWQQVEMGSGCALWKDENITNSDIYKQLHAFKSELDDYNMRIKNFELANNTDIRHHLRMAVSEDDEHTITITHDICDKLELHPNGLPGIFSSQQLSYTASGFVEPLLPPMRHPKFCDNAKEHVLDLSYLIHDFAVMCRKLKPTSRIVLIDMGASLTFHGGVDSPAAYIVELYRKFGMPFDHIYAFEMKQNAPQEVFNRVPDHWMSAYHWINVGVNADKDSKFNAYNILDNFNADDLIVVKLDIDTAAIEVPLAKQLLEDDRLKIIDQFYFEHHVFMKEIGGWWSNTMAGTIQESLELFSNVRNKGIAAHFWV